MDKVRAALVWLKRHHFWLLGMLVPLLAFGAWYMGAGTLQAKTEEGKKTINGAFSLQESIITKSFYPNDDVNKNQKAEIVEQAEWVSQTWQQLYDRQREQVLKWPELEQNFTEYMRDKNFGDPIRDTMRDIYMNYAKGTFSALPKIVGAKEVQDDGTAGVGGGFGGGFGGYGGEGGGSRYGGESGYGGMGVSMGAVDDPTLDDGSLVRWHDQIMIKQQLNFLERPSAIRIWVTQEDLWVYQTLLQAIAATNKEAGADRYSNAAVRDIFGLQVGKAAAKESRTKGRIQMPQAAMPTTEEGMVGEPPPIDGPPGEMDPYAMGESGMGQGPLTEEQERQILLTGRYIDAEGKPIVMTADPGALTIGVEYKRLPVRMVLKMDQRWLSFLIAQLANASLQIEVQEVRINPQSVDSAGAGGGMSGGEYGRSGGYGPPGGMGGGEYGGLGVGGAEEVAIFERQPTVAPVVIQGTVYIFNKPDPTQLEPEGGTEDATLSTATNISP
ncbi:MAG: hypothetical protein WD851_09860 [Pirellulales bacterium]